ncbi:NAD(P)/FAD-dependent oxidoreductase [Actinomadura sediminis]|uniref:NAD(P)/FAD-dependent oxidoreductase n=1 Tax=Actinomadura sediminis TaxID=1038904 RepID=A0ABW3F1W0_9ACTN
MVVGASLAGLRAAQTLRDEGHTGELTLVGAEPLLPYNRPPLSKSTLTGDDDVALPGNDELDARWLIGRTAVGLDVSGRAVTLDDGTRLPYDGLVITTGARPRRLDDDAMSLDGVHLLRTFDDAMNLRKALRDGPRRVAVIGGGIIGGEVSSTLRSLGIEVVLIDAAQAPMAGPLGETVGGWLAEHHARHGVELVSGVRVASLEGDGHVSAVRLSDGRSILADLVIAGLGVLPNTEWLDGSGLQLDDGVLTDSALFARGHANIVAAGDVARWPHGVFDDEYVRIEHWANANEQGAAAARNLLRGPQDAEPFTEVHSLGTRVHGTRVQWAGLPRTADEIVAISGSLEEEKFSIGFGRGGRLVGAVAVNWPKELIRLRRAIAARQPLSAAAAA